MSFSAQRATARLFLVGCAFCALCSSCLLSSAIDELDNAADCNTICNGYRKCVDGAQDLTACVERCEDRSDADDRFMERVDDCESCIDESACDISVKCERACGGVVP
jgi:hypothetical protein